jgi:anti-sigma B factor antagonist
MENTILIGIRKKDIYLKATGHITANQCFTLRETLYNELNTIKPTFSIYLDLSQIEYMDSTFIGLILGLNKKLNKNFNKPLHIINASNQAIESLKDLAALKILSMINKKIPSNLNFKYFDENKDTNDIEKLKIILFSHNNLSSINENNKNKFKKLQSYIKKELKRKKSS